MNTPTLNPFHVREFLNRLANVWLDYRALGYLIAQHCARDVDYQRSLLVDPGIQPGDLLRDFGGVARIVRIVGNEVEFVEKSGQTLFATFGSSEVGLKLKSMKIECPVCFGEPQEPPCGVCLGAGRV